MALLIGALAAVVLAISEGPSWGWASAPVLALFVVVPVLGAAFLFRSAHHPEPVLDLSLFGARTFSVANAAVVLYAMGFYAMLLGNVLFLTGVWHYSILKAGLAITPGPLVVAAVSGPAGRLATRVGFRAVLVTGAALLASGLIWYATRVGLHPAYLTEWLPATIVTGLGIGLTFPVLSAAAVSSLPGDRFAVGSAVNQTARQVGGSIGIAILVVVLGAPASAGAALSSFHHLWVFAATMSALSGAVALLLGPPLRAETPAPSGATIVRPAGQPPTLQAANRGGD